MNAFKIPDKTLVSFLMTLEDHYGKEVPTTITFTLLMSLSPPTFYLILLH